MEEELGKREGPIKHIKFSSIKNIGSASRRFCNKYPTLAEGLWQAREKLDGCNFCMIYDGKTLRGARRNALLKEDDEFHGYQAILKRYLHNVEALYEEVEDFTSVMRIYGELVGNWYPHPDVAPSGEKRVHHCKTAYHPGVEFVVFDLVLDKDVDDDLDYTWNLSLAEEVGFHVAPLIAEGTLSALCALSPTFASKVPEMFGLPEMEHRENFAEGVVITYGGSGKRHRFKHKRKECSEVATAPTVPTGPTSSTLKILGEIQLYINENRLASVLSKMLPIDQKDRYKVVCCLVHDALEEYGHPTLDTLEKKERKRVMRNLVSMAHREVNSFQLKFE